MMAQGLESKQRSSYCTLSPQVTIGFLYLPQHIAKTTQSFVICYVSKDNQRKPVAQRTLIKKVSWIATLFSNTERKRFLLWISISILNLAGHKGNLLSIATCGFEPQTPGILGIGAFWSKKKDEDLPELSDEDWIADFLLAVDVTLMDELITKLRDEVLVVHEMHSLVKTLVNWTGTLTHEQTAGNHP